MDREDSNLFQLGQDTAVEPLLDPEYDDEAAEAAEKQDADEAARKRKLGKIGAIAASSLVVLGFGYFAYSSLNRAPVGTGIPPVPTQAALAVQEPVAPSHNPYAAQPPQTGAGQPTPEAKISVGPNSVVITPQVNEPSAPTAKPSDVPLTPSPSVAASPAIASPAIPSTEPRFEAVEKKAELLSEKLDLLSERLGKLEGQISSLVGKMEKEKATKVSAQQASEKKPIATASKATPEKTKSSTEPSSAKGAIPNHSIQSIIVGQAWIVDRLNQVHVVREGDTLPLTGAKIVKIDPSKGEVTTTKGVIRSE